MSVFTKPFDEYAKKIECFKRVKDNDLFLHFFSRAYESFVSRLTPTGDGDLRMFRRMPEYFFFDGAFGVFEGSDGLHAWRVAGIDGIDEYGYPLGYILYSANGKNAMKEPLDTKKPPKGSVVMKPDDVVIFRANRGEFPIYNIIAPILERMTKTVRAVDHITGKRGLTAFSAVDARAKKAINEIDSAIEDGESIKAITSPDLSTSAIKTVDLFGSATLPIADLWESFRHFEGFLWETIGENTVSFEKKERLVVSEVESNDERIAHGIFGVAFEEMKAGIEKVNERWGTKWKLPEPEKAPDPETDPDPNNEPDDKTDDDKKGGEEE